jgi:large subunit ribosomal protein L17
MAVKPLAEKLISLGKKNSLHARRQAYKILGDHRLVSLLFKDIALRFNNRAGGYTRILGYGRRRGDNAEMVLLELTEIRKKEPKKHKKPKEAGLEKEKPVEEKKTKPETAPGEKGKPPVIKKPDKKFLGGLRNIFKKKSDSL